MLTPPQETELIQSAQHGDQASIARVMLAYAPLCRRIVRRFSTKAGEGDDLMQEARIGLMLALRAYDPGRGMRFGTYARWHICNTLSRAVRHLGSLVQAPRGEMNPIITDLHAPVSHAAEGLLLSDVLADPDAPDPLDAQCLAQTQTKARHVLAEALESMDARMQKIIRARLIADEAETLESLAVDLGISRERVRQIEVAATEKLRRAFRRARLGPSAFGSGEAA